VSRHQWWMVIVTHESYDSVLVGTGKQKGLESLSENREWRRRCELSWDRTENPSNLEDTARAVRYHFFEVLPFFCSTCTMPYHFFFAAVWGKSNSENCSHQRPDYYANQAPNRISVGVRPRPPQWATHPQPHSQLGSGKPPSRISPPRLRYVSIFCRTTFLER